MSRRTLVNLVFFLGVFMLMLYWAVNNIVTLEALEDPYAIVGEFDQASGIRPDAEVAYLGVHYGRVSGVERIPGGVRIQMKIDRGKQIPAGSSAHIFRKSAIGEPYIDFKPPAEYEGDRGPYIEKGEVVPKRRTTVPLEFSELLRAASAVVGGVSPEQTNTLLHELSVALEGRAPSLRELAEAGDELSRTFAEKTELLDRLATNNTRLTRVVTEHRGSLGDSLGNLRQLADTLRRAKGDTSVLLDRGSQLLGETADLVAAEKGNLDCILKNLEHVIDIATTGPRLEGLRTLLDVAPGAFAGVWDSRDTESDGVWVRVNLLFSDENPPPQYIPPHTLPKVPDVPPCASPLRSTGVDYVPAASHGSTGPAGPVATLLLLVVLAVMASGVVLGVTRRER